MIMKIIFIKKQINLRLLPALAMLVGLVGCANINTPVVEKLFPHPPDTQSLTLVDYMAPMDVATIISGASLLPDGTPRHKGIRTVPQNNDDFRGHQLDDIYWSGISAQNSDFRGTFFRYANCSNSNFSNSDFKVADIRWTNFSNSILENCDFTQARMFHLFVDDARMSNSSMRGANMFGMEGHDANLRNCDLSFTLLKDSEFINCKFSGSIAVKANFVRSVLLDATADSCDFSYSDFTGASLEGSSFVNSRFIHTNFQGAHLQQCDFTGADLQACSFFGAEFENTILRGAINIPEDIQNLMVDGIVTGYYISDNDKEL